MLQAVGLYGQASGAQNLHELSLEEILNLQVTSVGRKAQKVANAPAAVYVISQEEIRRSGAQTLPDLLKIVPGLMVARINANTWAISARGGAQQFANKMQVMIDGRSVYNRVYSGVFWELQDVLIEDIDRVEVIRGTGAVMWGSNAVNGVIHIITKKAQDSQGTQVAVGTGNEDVVFSSFRYGGKIGAKAHYRVWARQNHREYYFDRAPLLRYTLSGTNGQPQPGNDGYADGQSGDALRTGFRIDWTPTKADLVEVVGMGYGSRVDIEAFAIDGKGQNTRFRGDEDWRGGNVLGRWTHSHRDGSETMLQLWTDRSIRSNKLLEFDMSTGDIEMQHRRSVTENHELQVGAGVRVFGDTLRTFETRWFERPDSVDTLSYLSLRDEAKWFAGKLTLMGGVRLEHNVYTGFETQPTVRLLYAPSKPHTFWGAWSRAVRVPSRIERDLHAIELGGFRVNGVPGLIEVRRNDGYNSERNEEWTSGYRYQRRQSWSVDLALFHNKLTRLLSTEYGSVQMRREPELTLVLPVYSGNGRRGTSKGFEVQAMANPTPWWKVHGSYSYLSSFSYAVAGSLDPRLYLSGTEPRHQLKVRSLLNLGRNWEWDNTYIGVAGVSQVSLPSRNHLDSRLGYRPNRGMELSLTAQNLLNQRQVEFPSQLFQYAVPVRRTLIARWLFRF